MKEKLLSSTFSRIRTRERLLNSTTEVKLDDKPFASGELLFADRMKFPLPETIRERIGAERILDMMRASGLTVEQQRDVMRFLEKEFETKDKVKQSEVDYLVHKAILYACKDTLTDPVIKKIVSDLAGWGEGGFIMQRPTSSKLHDLIEALEKNPKIFPMKMNHIADILSIAKKSHSFLIEHDWSAAFKNAKDFDGGEYRLPYENCAFEFQISGRRVIVLAGRDEPNPNYWAYILYSKPLDMWMPIVDPSDWRLVGTRAVVEKEIDYFTPDKTKNAEPSPFYQIAVDLARQIRAVCISLETEIAYTDVTRAPHKPNVERAKRGRPMILDFHTVRLSNRRRYLPHGDDHIPGQGTKKRLHFVRGHWRNFETSKTWVKWHLRGDPDLGFIDKEYRL